MIRGKQNTFKSLDKYLALECVDDITWKSYADKGILCAIKQNI